jgi:hypothetical protein
VSGRRGWPSGWLRRSPTPLLMGRPSSPSPRSMILTSFIPRLPRRLACVKEWNALSLTEVRISRLAMAPGTVIDAAAAPYPALMYIETGTTACPGGPGRIGYGPDGTITEETTGEGIQYTPAGATQYIPANVPDGAGNEEPELMSSIIIEFVPVEQTATPTT